MVALLLLPLGCTRPDDPTRPDKHDRDSDDSGPGDSRDSGDVDDSGEPGVAPAIQVLIANQSSDRLELYDLADPTAELGEPAWRSPVIPGLSEGKHVTYLGQDAVLATTDNGAIVYSYPDNTLLFQREITGYSMNIHSAEVLPDGNVVAADSSGWLGLLYADGDPTVDANTRQPSDSTQWYELTFAHGVVYSQRAGGLWGLGYLDLVLYRYQQGDTPAGSTLDVAADFGFDGDYDRCVLYDECDESGAWEDGGHDLYPVTGSESSLWLTTGEHAFLFDMDANPVSGPGRTVAVLERYAPMYALDSTISQRVAPTAEAEHLVLQKGGLKAISGDPSPGGFVLAHSAPWFTDADSYPYDDPRLLYSSEPDDQLDVDLSDLNHLVLPGGMRFYKARIF